MFQWRLEMKNIEFTIKEMQNIVVKLARCTLRSIVDVILSILNLTSYI